MANLSTHKYGKTNDYFKLRAVFNFNIVFISRAGLWLIRLFSFYRLSANDLLRFYDLCAIHDFDHNYAIDGLGHSGREVMLALCLKAFRCLFVNFVLANSYIQINRYLI